VMSHIQLTEMPQNDLARKRPIFFLNGFSIRLKPQNVERASQIPEQKTLITGSQVLPSPSHNCNLGGEGGVISVISVITQTRHDMP